MHSHDPTVVWYKQVTPSQIFTDYCLMILQIIITEHLWGTSCAWFKRPQDHSCACPRCDFLMDVHRYYLRGHETVTTEHLLMESPDCIKQPQNHGSVCSRGDSLTDVQRLLSARPCNSNRWTSVRESLVCIKSMKSSIRLSHRCSEALLQL